MTKECKKCKVLEKQILILSRKYEDLISYAMQHRTIEDLDRTLAEKKLLEVFRKNGVFGYQVETKPDYFTAGGMKQSLDIKQLKKIVNNLSVYF